MIESGKIVKTSGKYATVRIDKKDECSKCGMCLFPKNANYLDIEAKNQVDAKEGDFVEVEREEGGKLISVLLVFLVPLILVITSVIVTYLFKIKEIWILILSAISVILWYTVLAFIDNKIKKKFSNYSNVVRVLKQEKITVNIQKEI